MRSRSLTLTGSLALVAVLLAACDGDEEAPPTLKETPSSTVMATSTAAQPFAGTVTEPGSIATAEEIDFTDPAIIGPLIDHFGGGEVDPARVQYVDLTRDGTADAFVVVESGGTAGDLGAVLLTVEDGAAAVAGTIDTGGRVEVRFPEVGGGIVVTTEGVWEPADPECCPSKLRESTYEWEDGAFVRRNVQVVDNPDVEGE